MHSLNLALIGNCTHGSLIDKEGKYVWACLPRFDSDPVLCNLLTSKDDGYFEVELQNFSYSEQHYIENTAILVTNLFDKDGAGVSITDFSPRYFRHGRIFRPMSFIRNIQPINGNPIVKIKFRPLKNYGEKKPDTTRGSNHVRYLFKDFVLRLTSDIPITYILDEKPFLLRSSKTIILGPDESVTQNIEDEYKQHYQQTKHYWQSWSRSLSIPFEWQQEIIRAAITLKLCSFEETGAIVAALTTSIPEAPNTGRNWDYRYCWIRDALFVVRALNQLGDTKTMENYLNFISNVALTIEDGDLQPCYGIGLEKQLVEFTSAHLDGYRNHKPVRIGNAAYFQKQNDVYGAIVLACMQLFYDKRLINVDYQHLYKILEKLGDKAWECYNKPDSGIWELRDDFRVNTFSALMCWVACDRLAHISRHLQTGRENHWYSRASKIKQAIETQAWNGAFYADSFGGNELDASLLLMPELGFVTDHNLSRFEQTVLAIEKNLRKGNYVFRYNYKDDFGFPEVSFNVCTFWYIDALSFLGRKDEARDLLQNMFEITNHVGLLSEDYDLHTNELWGNFPQTYSMVGLLNSALKLSKTWDDALRGK